MLEELIVRYCSPTLAGMKTGSLFTCPYAGMAREKIWCDICQWNKCLRAKGLRIVILQVSSGRALIYVYRPKLLQADLKKKMVREILETRGYSDCHPEHCLLQLVRRLQTGTEFPHEIGLFLGYPAEDVRGFIMYHASNSKCTGYWKVYGDPDSAEKLFKKYRRCSEVYCEKWKQGSSLERLTVAS